MVVSRRHVHDDCLFLSIHVHVIFVCVFSCFGFCLSSAPFGIGSDVVCQYGSGRFLVVVVVVLIYWCLCVLFVLRPIFSCSHCEICMSVIQ